MNISLGNRVYKSRLSVCHNYDGIRRTVNMNDLAVCFVLRVSPTITRREILFLSDLIVFPRHVRTYVRIFYPGMYAVSRHLNDRRTVCSCSSRAKKKRGKRVERDSRSEEFLIVLGSVRLRRLGCNCGATECLGRFGFIRALSAEKHIRDSPYYP